MSHFESNPYNPAPAEQMPPPRTSGMATTSLVSSIIGLFCCPAIGSLIGVLTGAIAIASIGRDPTKKGKGIAVTGLLLGLIGLVIWIIAGVYIGRFYTRMFTYMQNGPDDVLTLLANNDIAGFKGQFFGPGATAADDEVSAFKAAMEDRWGAFRSATLDMRGSSPQPQFGATTVPFPYVLTFENATVSAEIEIAFADEQAGEIGPKLWRITIEDPDGGDLVYPPAGGP